MLNDMLSARHGYGRTFMVAMWLLGAIAAAQVVAVGWAVITRPQAVAVAKGGSNPLATTVATPDAAGASAAAVGDPSANPAITATDPTAYSTDTLVKSTEGGSPATLPDILLPAANGAAVPGSAVVDGAVETLALPAIESEILLPGPSPYPGNDAIVGAAGVENPAHAITHPGARRMLALALEYRTSGNMPAALRALRDANTLSPSHPRILSELASTYTHMGLDEKAAEFWRSVYVLGAERAGAFYDLADMALKGNLLEESAVTDTVLSIGEIETFRGSSVSEGEKVTLRIPILSRPGSAPNAADMAMLVYFYDTVNGGDFAPTTATTNEDFVSIPYDWQEGNVEVIEESYFQPVFTEVEKKELGERKYFGYIIELYYRDELQQVTAEPKELMGLKPGEPDPDQLPDLDGSEARDDQIGPGGELFPQP